MIKFYTDMLAAKDGFSYVPFLYPYFGKPTVQKHYSFLKQAFEEWVEIGKKYYSLTDSAVECDFILMPNDYSYIQFHRERFNNLFRLSIQFKKKLIVFYAGDRDRAPDHFNMILIKTSLYRNAKSYRRCHVIAMPAFCNDVLIEAGYSTPLIRSKQAVASLGFCGYARVEKMLPRLKMVAQDKLLNAMARLFRKPAIKSRKRGMFFRSQALKILQRSNQVENNFIIRSSFMNRSDSKPFKNNSRHEYLQNMIESDYVLCVKGEGNFSIRFFETLSMGRIPLLIDTDGVLPANHLINYDALMPIVPFDHLDEIASRLQAFHNALSPERFESLQSECRAVWKKYLTPHAFYENLCKDLVIK